MIERLYIERVAEGVYDVVCNDLVTTAPAAPVPIFLGRVLMIADGIDAAIDVLTERHRDECEDVDDIAGVRIGYKPMDLLAVAYGGDVRIVPEFQLTRTVARLMEAVE